jgi:hypothetical protein
MPFALRRSPSHTADLTRYPEARGRRVIAGLTTLIDDMDVIALEATLGRGEWAQPLAHELAHLQHPRVHDIRTRTELDRQEGFARRLEAMMLRRRPRRAARLQGLRDRALRLTG